MGFLARLLLEGGSSGESLTRVREGSLRCLNNNASLLKYSRLVQGVFIL